MRHPQDKLGQRVLVYELRHAIDRCRRKPWNTIARVHLDRLIEDNPRSVRSTHVQYNIGPVRRDWFTAYAGGPPARGPAESTRANSLDAR